METLFAIANPSVEDAGSIFVVDFIVDACFGRVRIFIGWTALAWTLVRAWIDGRWPSRRSAAQIGYRQGAARPCVGECRGVK